MGVSKVAKSSVEENVITMDRRRGDRRDREMDAQAPGSAPKRRKKQRRRHIDPTTCERDYSEDEIEFMRAMDDYKRDAGRMFPTCSEVLEVIRGLGYFKLTETQAAQLKLDCYEEEAAEFDLDADEESDEADV
ncbi:MAG: hypothetical protein MI861_08910 [Pirellulales bacterium]|nr:hypothetical protein [Pirellulales bacterium]